MGVKVTGTPQETPTADDYEAMAEFGRAKAPWLSTFLELSNGIPAHDTLWRVCEALNPEQFQHSFLEWMAGVRKTISKEVIAL